MLIERRHEARQSRRPRHRLERGHGHTPLFHARWPLRVAAQNLLANQRLYDCAYCINRRSSNVPRAKFTVEEVVQLTLDFYVSVNVELSREDTLTLLAPERRGEIIRKSMGQVRLGIEAGADIKARPLSRRLGRARK
jgi:predicted DNA-binding helix-hairpin-helix protein